MSSTDLQKIVKIIETHEKRIAELEKKLDIKKKIDFADVSEKDSVYSYILEMKSDGFFKNPRLFNEILKELSRRGHHYNRTSISKPMLKVIQSKELGRVGEKGNWKYVER